MAMCPACLLEMLTADGCTVRSVDIGGVIHLRLRLDVVDAPHGRCNDCGVLPGALHHPDCDLETCPACGQQFIGCACEIVRWVE